MQKATSTHKKKATPRRYVMQVWRTRDSWSPWALIAFGFVAVVLTSFVMGGVAVLVRYLLGAF